MNSIQAKKIPIPLILKTIGVWPIGGRTNKNDGSIELIYYAPYRSERKASLHVNPQKNVFFDFAVRGGTPVDLVMLYKKCSFKESLRWLEKHIGIKDKEYDYQRVALDELKAIELLEYNEAPQFDLNHSFGKLIEEKTKPLYFYPNSNYVQDTRKIPLPVAKRYLWDVFYTRETSEGAVEYFGLGMQNESNGFEVRSVGHKKFHGSINAKTFSYFRGGQKAVIDVFEGMFDFLSLLAMQKQEFPSGKAYVLHTSNLAKYVRQIIRHEHKGKYLVRTWFDNDKAGDQAHAIMKALSDHGFAVEDMRHKYKDHKDLNAFYVDEFCGE
jgi:hypothetical protein